MSNKTVRIIVCRVGRLPVAEVIAADERGSFLSEMQRIVGGYVDRVALDDGLDCWFHDEGLLLGLPLNRIIPCAPRPPSPLLEALGGTDVVIYHGGPPESFAKPGEPGEWRIYGDMFLSRIDDDEEGDLASVTDDDVARYVAMWDREDVAAAKHMNDLRTIGVVS